MVQDTSKQYINGRYHLHEKLGQGGMGIVHRATDRLTGETVALKQVFLPVTQLFFASRPPSQTTRELRLALAHEFQTLASMRHPNIISVLDYGFDEAERPFFTMDYLENAQTILAAGNGRSAAEKINLLLQTLEALAYLHRRGILHRDIKPGNILVVDDNVRVLDFGLSATKEQATESVGSWQYMAPEVLQGGAAREATDLYAVGVLAFQLFAGEHPFDLYAADIRSVMIEAEPDWRKLGVDQRLTAVIRTLLAKKPALRPQTANEAIRAFNAVLGQSSSQETAVSRRQLAIRESYLQAAKFVGRQAEVVQLTAALQEAKDGQGSAWLIGGESGVGKSRLIAEIRTSALVDGFQVVRGQSREGGGVPYQLWRQPLRQLVLMLPDMDDLMAGVLLPLVPDIAQLLQRPVAPAPNLNESAAQQRLFMTIARLFWQVERPLLLILEDLHWSDASLLPLPYLLRLVAEHKLLIISSYRNDERPNLPNELPEMTHLPLARLGAAAMANLSAAMLGEAGRDQEIQALLQRETEGNAFFAVEVVRALAEEAGRLGDIGKVTLPETLLPNGIQDIVQRRVSKLSELARELLVKTAVAGRELELPLIQQLSGSLNVENEWLPLCADAAILNVQNGVWQFSHGKIRDGLLAELTAVEKTARHEEVASAIEQIYSQPATQAVRLAHHWREALDSEKEQHYAKIAGDEAAAQYAHQDALFYFNRILELTSPTDWAKRYSLLFQCFNTYALTGDLDKQQETLQALSGCAEQLDDNAKRLETLVEYTSFYRKYRQSDKLEAIYTRAVPLAQKIGDIRNEFVLLTNWALFLGESRQLEAAFMTLEQSRSLYERLGTVTTRMSYLVTAANLNYYAEDVDKSLGYLTEYLQLAEESKLLFPIFRGSSNIGVIYQAKGEFELAEQHYKRALQVARERGELNGEVLTLINTGDLCNLIGQYEQTIAISETVLSASEQIGRWYFYRLGLLNRGWARFKLGAIDQAKAVLQDVIRRSQAANDAWNEVAGWNKLGHIFLSTRHPNEALQAFQTAESRQADLSQTSALVETWAGLAGAEMALGHLEQATAYAEQVVTYVHAEGLKDSWLWVQSILYVYQVLSKAGSEEAQEILAQAHAELQIRAAKFTKATSRENFLMQVPENEQLLLLYKQLGKGEQGAIDDNSF